MRITGAAGFDRIGRAAAEQWLALWPSGGQGTARRNAWAAMVSGSIAARAREEADRAFTAAAPRQDRLTALP